MPRTLPAALAGAAWLAATVTTPATSADPFEGLERAQILLLGTFHFDDRGLDSYKPEFAWDALSEVHQGEIEAVVEQLAAYAPTRIALEWPASEQAQLDSLYAAYRSGAIELSANERQQLGFRLAHRLGHERVYAVDTPGRSYFPEMTQEQYDERVAELVANADPELLARQNDLQERYTARHRASDAEKQTASLGELLLRVNDPDQILQSHGEYLIGSFYLGQGDDYLGPDLRTRWYNRNLRIFRNVQGIASPGDRVLLVIGAGHLPILRQAAQASPEFELREVSAVLKP